MGYCDRVDFNAATSALGYQGLFSNWGDVSVNFSGERWGESGAVDAIPEPEEVILAAYEYEDYSGDAIVVYRDKDRYYVVNGGHCSCYGLEGQWAPEEYDIDTLKTVVTRQLDGYGLSKQFAPALLAYLEGRT